MITRQNDEKCAAALLGERHAGHVGTQSSIDSDGAGTIDSIVVAVEVYVLHPVACDDCNNHSACKLQAYISIHIHVYNIILRIRGHTHTHTHTFPITYYIGRPRPPALDSEHLGAKWA